MSSKFHHAVALALAVAGLTPQAQAQRGSRSAPLAAIEVTVVDGAVRVSPGTLPSTSGSATLVWQLKTEGFRFSSASIDFGDNARFFSCSTANFGMTVSCVKSAQAPKTQLSYRILLSDGQATVDLPQPDVFIMND